MPLQNSARRQVQGDTWGSLGFWGVSGQPQPPLRSTASTCYKPLPCPSLLLSTHALGGDPPSCVTLDGVALLAPGDAGSRACAMEGAGAREIPAVT